MFETWDHTGTCLLGCCSRTLVPLMPQLRATTPPNNGEQSLQPRTDAFISPHITVSICTVHLAQWAASHNAVHALLLLLLLQQPPPPLCASMTLCSEPFKGAATSEVN